VQLLPAGIFFVATALVFWPYLFSGETLFAGDTAFVFLPLKIYGAKRLAAGELPLWNPYIFGGVPYLADPQAQFFYPLNILLPWLGSPKLIAVSIPLHAFLTCCATYGFARAVLRLSPPAATLAGLLFGLGGQFQSKAAIPVYYTFFPWLPATLWALEALRTKFSLPRLVVVVALLGVGLSTMCYPYFSYLMIMLGFRMLMPALSGGSSVRHRWVDARYLLLAAGGVAGAIALSCASLLPAAELARLSDRSLHPDYDFVTNYSIKPLYLLSGMLFPGYFGTFQSRQAPDYSMAQFAIYPTMIGLLLAVLGISFPNAPGRRHPWTFFLILVAGVSCFFALGKYNPAYYICYKFVPGFGMFRAPAGFLILCAFAISCLAGLGADSLLQSAREERLLFLKRGCYCGVAMITVMILFLVLVPPPSILENGEFLLDQIRQILILVLALLSLLALRPAVQTERPGRVWSRVSLWWIGLAFIDLYLLSMKMEFQDTVPVDTFDRMPLTLRTYPPGVERRLNLQPLVPIRMRDWKVNVDIASERSWRIIQAQRVMELLCSTWADAFGVHGLDGAWGALFPLKRKVPMLYKPSSQREKRPWLDLLGVEFILAQLPQKLPRTRLEFAGHIYIYRNLTAFPRAFVAYRWEEITPTGSPESQLCQLATKPGFFPPVLWVGLEGNVPIAPVQGTPAPQAQPAEIHSYRPERIDLFAVTTRPGLVVLSDPPFPGWRVWVDGKQSEMLPVDVVMRGVSVGPGKHQVLWLYLPASVKLGVFISLVTAGVCLGVMTFAWSRTC